MFNLVIKPQVRNVAAVIGTGVCLWLVGATSNALARPSAPGVFCAEYPNSPLCAGASASCKVCHTSTSPASPGWNTYGLALLANLPPSPYDFETALPGMLAAVADDDSDSDSVSNIDEIDDGSLPGDAGNLLEVGWIPFGEPNPRWNVGGYDYAYAYRRASAAVCGQSPSYAEMQQLATTPDPYQFLHDKLQLCLDSSTWRDRLLPRLADGRIRPVDFTTMFNWDYRLWRWVLTGDRDMRDLLLADYHVRELDGQLEVATGIVPTVDYAAGQCVDDGDCNGSDYTCAAPNLNGERWCNHRDFGQELQPEYRAGMITTGWFHFYNTMFSALPRQTAAQAYRAYAGMDLARQQGIHPVGGEPLDLDNKGVQQAECAQCHTTLDPLSYVFAYHHGIGGGPSSGYSANRPTNLGLWTEETKPTMSILGQEVTTVREWAQVLAASDQFKRVLADTFYRYLLGHAPRLEDLAEFTALWQGMDELGWTANGLIHAIVDTIAFGAP